jgi:ABC-type multidrug transport system fused ATPase/permease subunit
MKKQLLEYLNSYLKKYRKEFTLVTILHLIMGSMLIFLGLKVETYSDSTFKSVSVLAAAIMLLKIIEEVASSYFARWTSKTSTQDLFAKLLNSKGLLTSKLSKSQQLERLEIDYPAFTSVVFSSLPTAISQTLLLFALCLIVGNKNPILFLSTLGLFFIFGALAFGLTLYRKRFMRKMRHLQGELYLQEKNLLWGFEYLHQSKKLKSELSKLNQGLQKLFSEEIKVSLIDSFSSSGHWIFRVGFILILSSPIFSALKVNPTTIFWAYLLFASFSQLYWAIRQIGQVQVYWSRIKPVLDDISDTNHQFASEVNRVAISLVNTQIGFDPNGTVSDLGPFNIEIHPSESLWIEGKSGSGKTTLIKTITGTHPIIGGSLFIPNEKVSYISQRPFFFEGETFANNLSLHNFTEKSLTLASELGLTKLFNSLPDGLNTRLGEEGYNPSVGQKVRLAIFRELIKNPRVLLLDEPTAGLDYPTAILVVGVLKREMQNGILIISEHDMSLKKVLNPTFQLNLDEPIKNLKQITHSLIENSTI